MRQNWQMWQGVSRETIDFILKEIEPLEYVEAKIFSGNKKKDKVRRSHIKWCSHNNAIRNILWSFVSQSNRNAFGFDVTDIGDIQYTEYLAIDEGHYDIHHDIDWNSEKFFDRKLSITVQLSEPEEYQGGDFEFTECKSPTDYKKLGTVLVFPSYLQHKVTPVIKGKRKSLVAWFEGPRWK